MSHQWQYRPWRGTSKQVLRADDILEATTVKDRSAKTKLGLIRYADQAYAAARIVGLAAHELHPASLYFMGQAKELYLKALLYDRLDDDRWARAFGDKSANAPELSAPKASGHILGDLARDVGTDHPEFVDPEFLLLCDHLTAFQEAGRYPDHRVQRWAPTLSCLTFLDAFVVHCREIMGIIPIQRDATLLNTLFTYVPPERPAEAAQQLGVLEFLAEENVHLPDLTGFSQDHINIVLASAKSWVNRPEFDGDSVYWELASRAGAGC